MTKLSYAVKIVSRKTDCNREVNLLRLCQGHPNIVTMHDVFHDEVCVYVICKFIFNKNKITVSFYKLLYFFIYYIIFSCLPDVISLKVLV